MKIKKLANEIKILNNKKKEEAAASKLRYENNMKKVKQNMANKKKIRDDIEAGHIKKKELEILNLENREWYKMIQEPHLPEPAQKIKENILYRNKYQRNIKRNMIKRKVLSNIKKKRIY